MKDNTYFYHLDDGFYYHRSSARNGTIYYKCIKYERGCRARAVYSPNYGFEETERSPGHDHERDPLYPDEVALRRAVLERCKLLEYISFRDIIDEEGAWYVCIHFINFNFTVMFLFIILLCYRFDIEVSSRVTLGRMRNSMRTARLQKYPDPPTSLRHLSRILNDDRFRIVTQTDDGQDNIYGGSVTARDGSHHILFVSKRMLNILRTSRILHGDGTVKVVPTGANANLLAQQVHLSPMSTYTM